MRNKRTRILSSHSVALFQVNPVNSSSQVLPHLTQYKDSGVLGPCITVWNRSKQLVIPLLLCATTKTILYEKYSNNPVLLWCKGSTTHIGLLLLTMMITTMKPMLTLAFTVVVVVVVVAAVVVRWFCGGGRTKRACTRRWK